MSLVNCVPMVVMYSLNLSAINFLYRVKMPFIKNSWLCCEDVFLPIISLIICNSFSGYSCACQIPFDSDSALLFNKLR